MRIQENRTRLAIAARMAAAGLARFWPERRPA